MVFNVSKSSIDMMLYPSFVSTVLFFVCLAVVMEQVTKLFFCIFSWEKFGCVLSVLLTRLSDWLSFLILSHFHLTSLIPVLLRASEGWAVMNMSPTMTPVHDE